MEATIKDVARRASVAPITVSRTLSGVPIVSPATRERVLKAIDELDYAPNLLARGLVQNRTTTIGALVLELANPFYMPMMSAIQSVSHQRGYLLVAGESARDIELEREYLEQFHQLRVAGIVVTPCSTEMSHLSLVRKKGIPVVSLSTPWKDGDFVAADNTLGGGLVSRHLLSLGHHRIGCVFMAERGTAAIDDRVRGFHAGLAAAGFAVPAEWQIATAGTTLEDGAAAADTLLARGKLPTAIFATTDRLAIGLIHRIRQLGVRVPEDLAVVGCDDIPYAETSAVPLTTLSIPKRRMGEEAARLLFERITAQADGHDSRRILLAPELVIRKSCGYELPWHGGR